MGMTYYPHQCPLCDHYVDAPIDQWTQDRVDVGFYTKQKGTRGCRNPYSRDVVVFDRESTSYFCHGFEGCIEAVSLGDALAKVEREIEKGHELSRGFARDIRRLDTSLYDFGKGVTVEEARKVVLAKIAKNHPSYTITEEKIVEERQTGTAEVRARSLELAVELYRKNALRGSKEEDISCIAPPKKRFLGLGTKKGKWVIKWVIPLELRVYYKTPAYCVRYTKKD
jgi:hypothetical protein